MFITFCTFVTSERTCSHNSKGKDYHRRNYKVFFYAIILARVLYVSPAQRGYLSAENIDSVQQLFIKAKR